MVFAAVVIFATTSRAQAVFNFDAPTLESGVNLNVGAVYRFASVDVGVDALLTITALNNGAAIGLIDDFSNGGFQSNFQPTLIGKALNGASADFHFQFVQGGTGTPTTIAGFTWSMLDVDGSPTLAESVTLSGFESYTIDNPTNIGVTDLGMGRFSFFDTSGSTAADITTAPAYSAAVDFTNISSFDVNIALSGSDNGTVTRLFSQGSTDPAFVSPVASPAPEPGTALLVGAAGLIVLLHRRRIGMR